MATQTKRRPAADRGGTIDAAELAPLLEALQAAARGEQNVRLETRKRGVVGDLSRAFNQMVAVREAATDEIVRVATAIGREGRLTERANTKGSPGVWQQTLGSVNGMIDDLSRPTLEVARVIDAVAEGDLTQKMQLKIQGRAVKGEWEANGRDTLARRRGGVTPETPVREVEGKK